MEVEIGKGSWLMSSSRAGPISVLRRLRWLAQREALASRVTATVSRKGVHTFKRVVILISEIVERDGNLLCDLSV